MFRVWLLLFVSYHVHIDKYPGICIWSIRTAAIYSSDDTWLRVRTRLCKDTWCCTAVYHIYIPGTQIFFLSGLGWHIPGLSQAPTWTPPPSITCWTCPAFLCFLHFFFFVLPFSHFFWILILCCSVFFFLGRKANRQQQLIRIFPSTAGTQPCDVSPSRLYHFLCRYRCDWRDQKQPYLCCHFNHMFHAFKTTINTSKYQLLLCLLHPSAITSPGHPVSVPIRHPRD